MCRQAAACAAVRQLDACTCWLVQVRWQGWDSEGRPLLLIRIAKACNEMSGNTADAVADAIICQACHCCAFWVISMCLWALWPLAHPFFSSSLKQHECNGRCRPISS